MSDHVAYEWDFDGACDPKHGRNHGTTFSVGIFQWIPRSSKKGLKRGKVVKRIRGPIHDSEWVYAQARLWIAAQSKEGL